MIDIPGPAGDRLRRLRDPNDPAFDPRYLEPPRERKPAPLPPPPLPPPPPPVEAATPPPPKTKEQIAIGIKEDFLAFKLSRNCEHAGPPDCGCSKLRSCKIKRFGRDNASFTECYECKIQEIRGSLRP